MRKTKYFAPTRDCGADAELQNARLLSPGLVRYTTLAVLFWLALYLGNYLTVFLQALGFSSSVIGYVNSAAAATGMLGSFAAGRISDRLKTVKWVCIAVLALTGISFLLFPLSTKVVVHGVSLALLWWPMACLFRSPVSSLVENWIVRGSYSERFNYGIARAGGSIGSCVSSILASVLVTALYAVMNRIDAIAVTYYVSGGLMLLCALYALTVHDVQAEEKQVRPEQLKLRKLFSNYYFVVLLAFNFLLNICINPPFVFLTYILSESGIDTAKLGMIIGWEALLELPLLFLLNFLRRKYPLYTLLIASGALFAVTAFGQGISRSLAALLVFGVFFGFANSLNFSCGFNYIYYIAPEELRATAHTMYTIAGALGIIAGNLFAGVLIDSIGVRTAYMLFAAATLLVSVLYVFSFPIGSSLLKQPLPVCKGE